MRGFFWLWKVCCVRVVCLFAGSGLAVEFAVWGVPVFLGTAYPVEGRSGGVSVLLVLFALFE